MSYQVSGNQVFGGNPPPATLVALAGGGQPAATAGGLAALIPSNQLVTNVTTVAAALDSIALPNTPVLLRTYKIFNSQALTCAIYPGNAIADPNAGAPQAAGSTINSAGANNPVFLGTGASAHFTCVSVAAAPHAGSTLVNTWIMSGYVGPRAVVPIAAAATLTKNHSECIMACTSAAADFKISMPAIAPGIKYSFTIAATAGSNQVQISATGAVLAGGIKTLAGTTTDESAAKTNVFLGNSTGPVASTIGDSIDMYSDGTSWIWKGVGHVAASIRSS